MTGNISGKHQIPGVKCRILDIFPVTMFYVIMMLIIIDIMTIDCWLLMINQCFEMVEAGLLVWIWLDPPIVMHPPKPTTSNGSFGTFASVIFWYLLFTSCRAGALFARKMCPDDVLNHASTNEAFLWHNFSFLPGNGQWSMAKAGHQCRQKTQAGFGSIVVEWWMPLLWSLWGNRSGGLSFWLLVTQLLDLNC